MSLHNFRAKIPMELNAPDDLLSKWQKFFDLVLVMYQPRIFFICIAVVFCWLILIKTQKFLFCRRSFHLKDEMLSVIPQTSAFAGNENLNSYVYERRKHKK